MKKIRGKNTAPEMLVRRLVYSLGFRYRLHDKKLPGKPDLVFRSRKKVIFVHGCFWHGHDCPKGMPPKSNLDYWIPKLEANKERDKLFIEKLGLNGWKVLEVWQCELKKTETLNNKIYNFLKST